MNQLRAKEPVITTEATKIENLTQENKGTKLNWGAKEVIMKLTVNGHTLGRW